MEHNRFDRKTIVNLTRAIETEINQLEKRTRNFNALVPCSGVWRKCKNMFEKNCALHFVCIIIMERQKKAIKRGENGILDHWWNWNACYDLLLFNYFPTQTENCSIFSKRERKKGKKLIFSPNLVLFVCLCVCFEYFNQCSANKKCFIE